MYIYTIIIWYIDVLVDPWRQERASALIALARLCLQVPGISPFEMGNLTLPWGKHNIDVENHHF